MNAITEELLTAEVLRLRRQITELEADLNRKASIACTIRNVLKNRSGLKDAGELSQHMLKAAEELHETFKQPGDFWS